MLCSPNIKNVGDKVQVYKAKDIVEHTNLNRGELILVGLVRGGDYDTVIHYCCDFPLGG